MDTDAHGRTAQIMKCIANKSTEQKYTTTYIQYLCNLINLTKNRCRWLVRPMDVWTVADPETHLLSRPL